MDKIFQKKHFKALFWVIFPVLCFFLARFIVSIFKVLCVFVISFFSDKDLDLFFADPTMTAVISLVFFVSLSSLIYFVPTKFFKQNFSKEDVGISKSLTWSDLGLGFLGFLVAIFLSNILTHFLSNLIPNFNVFQSQDVGFSRLIMPHQYILAFLVLVIITPFVEEFIFRGVIFGQLKSVNLTLAIVATSLMFGAAHGQWNVGVTTFAMSVVMCLIREKFTGSIWAGVYLHFLKNAIAFFVIYIAPKIMLFQYLN